MTLKEYFDGNDGLCVLATADSTGVVDQAVYTKPGVVDETTIALIMLDRLSHANLASNPHASILFIEKAPASRGRRLFITKLREEEDPAAVERFRSETGYYLPAGDLKKTFLVYFHVDRIMPLYSWQEQAGTFHGED
ncbi:MAG TPA: pyridoxamine 5'-phosphate oxidase family protein [Syntrophorhabdaceae bacterium]|jgi:hypothetical protein